MCLEENDSIKKIFKDASKNLPHKVYSAKNDPKYKTTKQREQENKTDREDKMNTEKLYYQAPSDQIFEEVQNAAIKIWNTYDDTHGYVSEKTDHIKSISNYRDNMMTIIAMFDLGNQMKLAQLLSPEAKKEVSDRMESGGIPNGFNFFRTIEY